MLSRRLLSVSGQDNWYDGAYAAWQAKGATSYAASYLDLTGNGRNLSVGVAPTWASGTGWTFNGTTQYLISPFVPSSNNSAIFAFSNVTAPGVAFGLGSFSIRPDLNGAVASYANGTFVTTAPIATSGVMAISQYGFRDGVIDTVALSQSFSNILPAFIGARNNSGSPANFFVGNILAIGFWNTTLDPATIATKSAQMAAL